MEWENVIGLEVHVELSTESKLLCACPTTYGQTPNTQCCEICTGMPGTLPTVNKRAVEYAVRAALALNGHVAPELCFDRKNYFYPDLPKAWQTSQLYSPICLGGYLDFTDESGKLRRVHIHELHLEEDAGKLIHSPDGIQTLIDFNRCGIPLIEIVTEPELRSAEDTAAFLTNLRSLLLCIGISDCKMQEGSLRADINLSLRRRGESALGVRTEMKNLNSFRAVRRAIREESRRQAEILEAGGKIVQETRRWDDIKGQSFSLRAKENAQDYRYFPEPDLPPVRLEKDWIEKIRKALPELPLEKHKRYKENFDLSDEQVNVLCASQRLSRLFEETEAICRNPKESANWCTGSVSMILHETEKTPEDLPAPFPHLGTLLKLLEQNKISRQSALEALRETILTGSNPEEYIKAHNLELKHDDGAVLEIVTTIINDNPNSVGEYLSGKEKAFQYLMGQCMRAARGQYSPQAIRQTLRQCLKKE